MSFISLFSGQSNTSLTATIASFTRPASATYALVLCAMRGADGSATTLTSVAMGAASFTLNSTNLRQFNSFQAVEVGWMLAADLPSGSVTVTATRGTATDGFTVAVAFFDDVDQTDVEPLVALNGADSSPPDPFTTSISPLGSATLMDIIASASNPTFTVEAGQTEASENTGDSLVSNVSYKDVTSGSNNMGWDTAANTNRTSHIIVSVPDLVASTSVALTGTVTATINEDDIIAGGKTIILTLTDDTFVAAGATFDAQRQAIIDGLDGV